MTGTLEKNPKAIIKVQLKYTVYVQDKSERHEIGKKTHCFLLKFWFGLISCMFDSDPRLLVLNK